MNASSNPVAKHRDFLVIDLEAPCDNGPLVPKHEMEIIEIGAVPIP